MEMRSGVHILSLHIAKMKNDHKKANVNSAGSEDTGTIGAAAIGAAATPTPEATKRRGPKQKKALFNPATGNGNDFAAGYGFDGETRTDDPTPS
ncbi:MAG: hypothetical protein Q9204_002425 [Flavoplaca sp. TL-2023a]